MDPSARPHIDRQTVALGVLDALPPTWGVVAFDRDMRFVGVYGDALRRAGWREDQILGHHAGDVLSANPETAPLVDAYREALAGGRARLRIERRSRSWDIDVAPLRDHDGRIVGGVALGHDITAIEQARRLHDARARAAELVAEAREDIAADLVREVAPILRCRAAAYWQPDRDGTLRCTATWVDDPEAPGLVALQHLTRGRAIVPGEGLAGGAFATGRIHVAADLRLEEQAGWVRAALDAGALAAAAVPAVQDGRPVGVFEFYAPLPIEADPDVAAAMAALVDDVAHALERRARIDALQELADHDGLTGLLNRRRFEEEVTRLVAAGARYDRRAALVVLDLDDFKVVNDRHGHAAGDELLRLVADVLRDRLRASDHAARVGGDEFAVILEGADTGAAAVVGRQLADDIAHPRIPQAPEIRPSVSVGVAAIDADGASFDEADRAMYADKKRRR